MAPTGAPTSVRVTAWAEEGNGAAATPPMSAAYGHRVAPDCRFLAALDGEGGTLWRLPCGDFTRPVLLGRLPVDGDASLAGCEWAPGRCMAAGLLPVPATRPSGGGAPRMLLTLDSRAITFHQVSDAAAGSTGCWTRRELAAGTAHSEPSADDIDADSGKAGWRGVAFAGEASKVSDAGDICRTVIVSNRLAFGGPAWEALWQPGRRPDTEGPADAEPVALLMDTASPLICIVSRPSSTGGSPHITVLAFSNGGVVGVSAFSLPPLPEPQTSGVEPCDWCPLSLVAGHLYALTTAGELHVWDARAGHPTGQVSLQSGAPFRAAVVVPLPGQAQPCSAVLLAAVDVAARALILEVHPEVLLPEPRPVGLDVEELLALAHAEEQGAGALPALGELRVEGHDALANANLRQRLRPSGLRQGRAGACAPATRQPPRLRALLLLPPSARGTPPATVVLSRGYLFCVACAGEEVEISWAGLDLAEAQQGSGTLTMQGAQAVQLQALLFKDYEAAERLRHVNGWASPQALLLYALQRALDNQDLELIQATLQRLRAPLAGTATQLAATRRLVQCCAEALTARRGPICTQLLRIASVYAASAIAALHCCQGGVGLQTGAVATEIGGYLRLLRSLGAKLPPHSAPATRAPSKWVATGPQKPRHPSWGAVVEGGGDPKGNQSEEDVETLVASAAVSGSMGAVVAHLQAAADLRGAHGYSWDQLQRLGRRRAYAMLKTGRAEDGVALLRGLGEHVSGALGELLAGSTHRRVRTAAGAALQARNALLPPLAALLERVALLEAHYPAASYIAARRAAAGVQGIEQAPTGGLPGWAEPAEVQGVLEGSWAGIGAVTVDGAEEDGAGGAEEVGEGEGEPPHSGWQGYAALPGTWVAEMPDATLARALLEALVAHAVVEGGSAGDALLALALPPLPAELAVRMGAAAAWRARAEFCVAHHMWPQLRALIQSEGLPEELCTEGRSAGRPALRMLAAPLAGAAHSRLLSRHMSGALLAVGVWPPSPQLETLLEQPQELAAFLARQGLLLLGAAEQGGNEAFAVRHAVGWAGAPRGLQAAIVQLCLQRCLPRLLQAFLDSHGLAMELGGAEEALAAARSMPCHWAEWILLSRLPGRGMAFASSFANAATVLPGAAEVEPSSGNEGADVDEPGAGAGGFTTVRELAAQGGGLLALATLMYAPATVQRCLLGAQRGEEPAWACPLEALEPDLQPHPSLLAWLRAATAPAPPPDWEPALSGDAVTGSALAPSSLTAFLGVRASVFASSRGDIGLLDLLAQQLGGALAGKGIAMLELLVHSSPRALHGVTPGAPLLEVVAQVEQRLLDVQRAEFFHVDPEEGPGMALESSLRRGRPMEALEGWFRWARAHPPTPTGAAGEGPTARLRRLVAASAISHYNDLTTVAAAMAALDVCSLPTWPLRVDVAALRRIAVHRASQELEQETVLPGRRPSGMRAARSFSQGKMQAAGQGVVADTAGALAQALVEEMASTGEQPPPERSEGRLPGEGADDTGAADAAVRQVLAELEAATLALLKAPLGGPSGDGSAAEGTPPPLSTFMFAPSLLAESNSPEALERSREAEATEVEDAAAKRATITAWPLVNAFCAAHGLPPSLRLLESLAAQGDWLHFLAEAQSQTYDIEDIKRTASTGFDDRNIAHHICHVVATLQAQAAGAEGGLAPSMGAVQPYAPIPWTHPAVRQAKDAEGRPELFEIIGSEERQLDAGSRMLERAQTLHWPLLAVVAACFGDVAPLDCLATWLGAGWDSTATEMASSKGDGSANGGGRLSTGASTGALPALATAAPLPAAPDPRPLRRSSEDILLPPLSGPEVAMHRLTSLCEGLAIFLPDSPLVHLLSFLWAFSDLRLPDTEGHLGAFGATLTEAAGGAGSGRGGLPQCAASAAAESVLATLQTAWERRRLTKLLAGLDPLAHLFRCLHSAYELLGPTAERFLQWDALGELRELLGEPSPELIDAAGVAAALKGAGQWDDARRWSADPHSVTISQAEALIGDWEDLLGGASCGPEYSLWEQVDAMFRQYELPARAAGAFFLQQAEAHRRRATLAQLCELLELAVAWMRRLRAAAPALASLQRELAMLGGEARQQRRGASGAHAGGAGIGRAAAGRAAGGAAAAGSVHQPGGARR
eukprot:jgi/Tetstr1/457097/TSEL_004161.t2